MSDKSVISIGNFDGVHLGHQAILRRARHVADACGCPLIVLTFDPHPAKTLRPGSEPPRLSSVHEKVDLLHQAGADRVVVLEPTPSVLQQTAQTFIEHLVRDYQPVAIVEGEDFRFGKGRGGDVALLTDMGRQLDFRTVVEGKVDITLSNLLVATVSSSLIRWLVGHGRVYDAAICLGRPFALTAPVSTGEQRGRTINVPTANLDSHVLTEHMMPADGVYAGLVRIGKGADQAYPAAISVGIKPTFGKRELVIESHLLDYSGDLYGELLSVSFVRWLRDQQIFPGLAALRAQLARDIAHTRQWHEQGLLQTPSPRDRQQRAG
jgi:riboflavin kinase/FMN adenylyltransferase